MNHKRAEVAYPCHRRKKLELRHSWFLSERAKMEASLERLLLPLLVVLTGTYVAMGWQQQERVLLREVQALTLYRGKYTNYRRTSPVPQLQCTGGSAGCTAYTPEVVQCYNKGWDGYDVQWECKAHLDVSYRFGKIEVNCEGYDYPDDPFILKGSCGLEYTLELTKEGQQKANTFSGTYYSATSHDSVGSGFGLILVILFVVFVFGVYKLFLCDNRQRNFPNDDVHSGSYGQSYQSPTPPGFKPNYTGAASGSNYDSNSGPGFWTGLGAGGLLGYLMGNRRSPLDHRHSPYYSTWAGPSAPPPFTGSLGNSSSCSTSYSSGTKPSSDPTVVPFKPPKIMQIGPAYKFGFGGTKRR